MTFLQHLSIIFFELLVLFWLTRATLRFFFKLLRAIFKKDQIIYSIIALIYFPGTVLHELSHMIAALLLLLRVTDVHVFPTWKDNVIILGRVLYEKKDVLRSILVGVAPLFGGIIFLGWLSVLDVGTSSNLLLQIIVIYLVFAISSTMFSSKQDLVDFLYVIPVGIVMTIAYYIFQPDFSLISKLIGDLEAPRKILYAVTKYLLVSISIHTIFIIIVMSGRFIKNKLIK